MSTRTRKGRKSTKGQRPGQGRSASTGATKHAPRPTKPRGRTSRGLSAGAKTVVVVGVGVIALGALYLANRPGGPPKAGDFAYAVGSPGPGEQAPPFVLPSTDGGRFDLATAEGKNVLLYFQEGLMCQPCWDQLVDIESEMGRFQALGIDEIVTITTDPLNALQQKVADEGITTPVLSDPDLSVSKAYDANSYGMMGDGMDGHSFILVGPRGKILWRADYGGAPDYTMYLPVNSLIADLRQGLQGS